MKKILFVCTGNICRSPTAEGVFRHMLEQKGLSKNILADSQAGTHNYHAGEAPDRRSIAAAKKRGVDISMLKARKVAAKDFEEFDLILGMDRGHVASLHDMASGAARANIQLFLEYAGGIGEKSVSEKDVPDPYYGNSDDFEYALDLIESGCEALVNKVKDWS